LANTQREGSLASQTFDIYAGTLTKGAGAGNTVAVSGIDGVTGKLADNAATGRGELTFIQGSVVPDQLDY